ncbi:MAG: ribosome maturation factor RimM [Bacilli bacterium]|nr:ribosome maturation factor RimM [Bacilli bacterium]
MDYLKIGKFVNTHGLKGEIKIISDLSKNGSVFNIGNTLYIGDNKLPFIIESYRPHQKYDMVKLKSLDSIDKVLPYKGCNIFINKEDISDTLVENLLNYSVYNNDIYIGDVIEILNGVKYDFIVVSKERIIIPLIDNFITKIDNDKHIIKTNYML